MNTVVFFLVCVAVCAIVTRAAPCSCGCQPACSANDGDSGDYKGSGSDGYDASGGTGSDDGSDGDPGNGQDSSNSNADGNQDSPGGTGSAAAAAASGDNPQVSQTTYQVGNLTVSQSVASADQGTAAVSGASGSS